MTPEQRLEASLLHLRQAALIAAMKRLSLVVQLVEEKRRETA